VIVGRRARPVLSGPASDKTMRAAFGRSRFLFRAVSRAVVWPVRYMAMKAHAHREMFCRL